MKKILCLVLAILMLFALTACGADKNAASSDNLVPDNSGKLLLGTSADYPPFEFIALGENGEQEYVGIDVYLAEKIAEDMGKELEVVNMNFDSLMASLQKGEIDIVIAAIEDTEERRVAADFSDPYYTDYPAMILVKAENADKYTDLTCFEGLSVGAQTGTTKADIVTNQMPGANFVGLTSVIDLVNELVYDKCAAIVLDGAVALQYVATNSDLVVAAASDELGAAAPFCVAVQKGDPSGLLGSVNTTVAAVTSDGTVDTWVETANALADQVEGE